MASTVGICNVALTRIGAPRIISLTDNTVAAKACNAVFDMIVEEVISEGIWKTTLRRANLSKTTNTPAFDLTNEFQLPTSPKCLKVVHVNESAKGYEYKIEGDKLVTDADSISIVYVALLEDSEDFGPLLTKAVTQRLTAELAYALTGKTQLADYHMRLYYQMRDDALAYDSQQGTSPIIAITDLIDIR